MAKGKVRCGQCFHIFSAQPLPVKAQAKPSASTPTQAAVDDSAISASTYQYAEPDTPVSKRAPAENNTPPVQEDGSVNPDWLDTLFHEEDLAAYTPPAQPYDEAPATPYTTQTPDHQVRSESSKTSKAAQTSDNLAPWEMELAELEEEFSQQGSQRDPVFSEAFTAPTSTKATTASATPPKAAQAQTTAAPTNPVSDRHEPDYMQALHSLAQDISKQDHLSSDEYQSQESMKQLAAQYSLASLTDSNHSSPRKKASKASWLWSLGSVAALLLLLVQVAVGFFETGSRSAEFRGFYRAACSYLSCTLPAFEDIAAIEIEHVRIQSHPTLANTLQVNAIMTNTSQYTQPMPKLALEFYDLNRGPVAARLFAPQNYLHRDFLDITTMPPSTPIHVVIPIQDPGARAVTHQIKVFSNQTQSY